MMLFRNSLIIVLLVSGYLCSTMAQTATGTGTGTESFTVTNSGTVSVTASNSWTVTTSNTVTNTITNTVSNTMTETLTNSISLSISNSLSLSQGLKPNLRLGSVNSQCFSVNFDKLNPDYPSYNFKVISSDNIFTKDYTMPSSSLLLINNVYFFTLCRSNETGLVPNKQYSAQVQGVISGTLGPLSFGPTFVLTLTTYTGPPAFDTNSINGLVCYYDPPFLTCVWNNGARIWSTAYFEFNCTRTYPIAATAYLGEQYSRAVLRNSGNQATLPTSTTVFLPSGCTCPGALIAIYPSAPTFVNLAIVSPTSFVSTDNSPAPNTPTIDIF